jgi:hypothetical protein
VPLSEHEQRLLEQMERALYAEDPKFASSLQRPTFRGASKGRLTAGVLVLLAGLGLLVTGVAVKIAPLGVVGFIAMLGGVVLAFSGAKSDSSETAQTDSGTSAAKPTGRAPKADGSGFMGRMEDRWRHRREGDQQ